MSKQKQLLYNKNSKKTKLTSDYGFEEDELVEKVGRHLVLVEVVRVEVSRETRLQVGLLVVKRRCSVLCDVIIKKIVTSTECLKLPLTESNKN